MLLIVQNKAVRFPARQQRDLSEYKEGGTYNAYGQAQVCCALRGVAAIDALVVAYCNAISQQASADENHPITSSAAQGLPPGSSGALRGEYYGPGSPPAAGASPNASRSSTPYAHGGNGHFAPSPLKPQAPGARHLLPHSMLALCSVTCSCQAVIVCPRSMHSKVECGLQAMWQVCQTTTWGRGSPP